MSVEPKILKQRLDLFEAIPAEARQALSEAMAPPADVDKNEVLRKAGGAADCFYLVDAGWFYSSSRLEDGGRQVYGFHLPGDLMGLQDLGWDIAVCDITAATPGRVIRIDKPAFRALLSAHPLLAGFFMTYGIFDHTQLIDRMRVVGRMEAIKRVGHLLLQLCGAQSEPAGEEPEGGYLLPIDQSLIGDAIGLTNISVSRMMGELESRGLIERSGRRLSLPDRQALAELSEFIDRRRSVPLSWLLQGD
ncbi:Crp/Fnr family transcriptional regulator [Parvularcula oceani]|uniref:Crp/Fnr family transcriptional regulator n=1 Tax=Parvularcula oceani TaxID=1247963 RepID=UPI00068B510E|nr:Crp/Fnr family transcriptional regulator [Parvularcula oceani]